MGMERRVPVGKYLDGKPDAMKVARPVWVGGKSGDQIKRLPIDIYCDGEASLYKGSKC